MAVTVDVVGVDINNGAGAVSPLTGTGPNVSVGATGILVYINSANTIGATSVSWASQTLTKVISTNNTNLDFVEVWGGVSPTTGAQTLTVNYGAGSIKVDAVVISYKGGLTSSVASAFPHSTSNTDGGTAGTTATASSVTSATNDLCTAFFTNNSGNFTSYGAGQTADVDNFLMSNGAVIGSVTHKAGATTVTQTAAMPSGNWSALHIDIAVATSGSPFNQEDWPNPYITTWYQHWQSRFVPAATVLPLNLRVQRDWPNPYPVYWYRSWEKLAATLPIPTVLPTPLRKQAADPNPLPISWYQNWIQQGIKPTVQNPFVQSNWSLPQPITWYQSWVNSFRLTNPFNQDDWPNPPRTVWYQNWSQSLNLFYQSETFPFVQSDYPNPQPITWYRSVEEAGNALTFIPGTPFVQSDWPLPRTYTPISQWWDQSYLINTTLTLVLVPFSTEFANAPGIQWIDETWVQNLLQTTLSVIIPPTPFFQNVDANTPVIVSPIDQTWIQNLTNFYQANTFPFSQKDYPNPYPVRWYVDHNQNLVIYLPVGKKPINQSDWPLTGAPKPIDQFYYQALALNLPTPPPPIQILSAGHQWTERDVLRSWMAAIGAKGRAIRYQPLN